MASAFNTSTFIFVSIVARNRLRFRHHLTAFSTATTAAVAPLAHSPTNQPGSLVKDYLREEAIEWVEGPEALAGSAAPPCQVKTLIFLVGGRPVAVVLPLGGRVNERKLAACLGVAKSSMRLAPAEELVALCGYPQGTVPPLGSRLQTVVDLRVGGVGAWYAVDL
jgi:hypothetical protein